jgi:hypothetical protein
MNEKEVVAWMARKIQRFGFGEGDLHRLYAKAVKTAVTPVPDHPLRICAGKDYYLKDGSIASVQRKAGKDRWRVWIQGHGMVVRGRDVFRARVNVERREPYNPKVSRLLGFP